MLLELTKQLTGVEKIKYKYVIIGAGLSGLSTAYELSKTYPGEILILEKDHNIGGLAKTISKNNSQYDLGSHRIHIQISEKLFNFINEVTGGSKIIKKVRGGKLRLRNSNIMYPIKSLQFFVSLGLAESFRCAVSLIKYRLIGFFKSTNEKSSDYETYLIYNAGKRAYKIFYEPYALKVWGVEPNTISITAVKKRMSMINPIVFIKDIISLYFKKDNISYYYYLTNGVGDIANGMYKTLLENKVKVITGVSDFQLINSGQIHQVEIATNSGDSFTVAYDFLVSTIPINEIVMKLQPDKLIKQIVDKVKWRGLKLVYLHLKEDPVLAGETFYFPEIRYIFGRVSIPKRFSKTMQPDQSFTSYICEVPCSMADAKWSMSPGQLYQKCFEDLLNAKLIRPDNEIVTDKNFIVELPMVYPLYTIGWQETILQLLHYLESSHKYIYTSGKCGFFMHCNMDHSIEIGMELAQYINDGKEPESFYNNINRYHSYKLRD